MMMEENADESNGESTFEFIENKGNIHCSHPPLSSASTLYPHPDQAQPQMIPCYSIASNNESQLASLSGPQILPPISLPKYDIPQIDNQFKNPIIYDRPNVPVLNQVPSYGLENSEMANQMSNLQLDHKVESQPFLINPVPYSGNISTQPAPSLYSVTAESKPDGEHQYQPVKLCPGNSPTSNAMVPDIGLKETPAPRGLFGWLKNDFINKIAEKAMNSVDTVITTLDPGMKEVLYSGGDIDIVVASEDPLKISIIREAFYKVFGRATVDGVDSQTSNIAPQPLGYTLGLKLAEERLLKLQERCQKNHIFIAIENFVVELTPDRWFDIGCLVLKDHVQDILLHTYTQTTPIPSHFISMAQEQTPADYPLAWSGYSVTIGEIISPSMRVPINEWHSALGGISYQNLLLPAAMSLAFQYKAQLGQI